MADENIIIKIEFEAEDGTIKTAFGKIQTEAEKASKNIGNSLGKNTTGEASLLGDVIGGIGKRLVGLAAGAFALNSIKNAIGGAVREAREGQDAINQLSASLALNGESSRAAVDGFVKYADQLSRLTGIDDDVIVKNGALLSSLTGLTGQGLERATRAALDLAQATGKDLSTATQLISRAANGGADALKKYGIVIDENTPKSEKFKAALEQIEKRFGGLADSRLNTFSGQVDNLSNAFGDLQKVFGNLIVESPAVREVLKVTSDLIRDLADRLKVAFSGDILGNVIKQVLSLSQVIATYLLPPIEIAFNILKTGFLAIQTGILGLAQPLINMQTLIIDNLVLPFINYVLPIMGKVAGFFREDFGQAINELSENIKTKLPQATAAAGQLAGDAYKNSLNALVTSSNDVFDTSVSANTQSLVAKYQTAVDQAKVITSEFQIAGQANREVINSEVTTFGEGLTLAVDGWTAELDRVRQNSQKTFKEIGAQMFQTIAQGGTKAFAALGAAIKKGQDPLAAFGDAMLAAFGDAFIKLGNGYILQGAAMLFAGDPNGGALIAAGGALAAFGGFLSASGGGGEGAGATSSGASGSTGGTATDIEDLNQLEPQEPKSSITLNVNGDVLDSNETGVRLTEILRDFADKNGKAEVFA